MSRITEPDGLLRIALDGLSAAAMHAIGQILHHTRDDLRLATRLPVDDFSKRTADRAATNVKETAFQ